MKKITLILTAALVSLSVLATDVQKASFSAKAQLAKQELGAEAKVATATENLVAFPAVEANEVSAFSAQVRKVAAQRNAATSTVAVSEVGYGRAKATITPADGADTLYYQIAILDAAGSAVAYVGYFGINNVLNYFNDTYQILRYAPSYGQRASGYTTFLPKGSYTYVLIGYPLTADHTKVDTSNGPLDYATAGFEITLDGTEYAIKDAKVEIGANNQLNVTWTNAAGELPEGAAYQVRVYGLPSNEVIANSGYELQENSWSTPDSITITDNSSFELYINIWSAAGYNLGLPADVFTVVGTDPNAPTELAVDVDPETLKATFTWKNTITNYQVDTTSFKVYNQVLILDEEGNEFIFDNGYNNTSAETGISEPLHPGKYTWQIIPFYANSYWYYIAVVNGEEFEVKDEVAPVIDSVFVANTSETEVNLGIVVTDNAPDVTPADLVFGVTGDITLTDAKLEEDGTLKLSELTPQVYHIQITATDPSGNKSEAYAFEFTPVNDTVAPTNLTAELDSVSDKFVTVQVSAEDDVATAAQLVYIFTFADGSVVEKQTTTGLITLDGLTPETDYEVTVTVKDFGGNVSEESVVLKFTTLELIPIDLSEDLVLSQLSFNEGVDGAYNYQLLLGGYNEGWSRPYVYFDITTTREHIFTGVYSAEKGNLDETYSGYQFISPETGKVVGLDIQNVTLELKYLRNETQNGNTYHLYYIAAEFVAEDGNIYFFEGGFYPNLWVDNVRTLIPEVFEDTDSPQLWVNEEYPVEVEGTTVEIMFGAFDGPFWLSTGEVYTEITNLALTIEDAEGNVLASSEAGTIVNTPTLDEDGAYYFTATLSNLEEETDYVVTINAADEAGNVAEPIAVSFTTGQAQGIEDIDSTVKAQKKLRNAQLIIERNGKEYNATGAQIK
ncbi:MAG: hypothetical protein IJS82_03270 [Paludibacteraceae bacterium]|nr:hypothetical protein [Paludibacteraceae bacterium]